MRHARADALDRLEALLEQLRDLSNLREKSRGVFYLRSKPFLHFHDDPTGLYADLRIGSEFERHPVSSVAEQRAFLKAVLRQLV